MVRLGSLESGGTKFICAVGDENYKISSLLQFPTELPKETLKKTVNYFKENPVDSLSVASFGPIETNKNSKKYGFITSTPKKNWQNIDVLGYLKKELNVPIYWTTDVNGSAYGEYIKAKINGEDINSLVYYTIGTGVGGGAISEGNFIGTIGPPEMGHVLVKRHPNDTNFKGVCPYHGDCLEGLVSGPTFEARLGKKGEDVSLSDSVWDIMAYYIAQAALQATLLLRPDKIVFGGGVTNETLLKKVRLEFSKMINNYIILPDLEKYIVASQIEGNGSATLGNFALADKKIKV